MGSTVEDPCRIVRFYLVIYDSNYIMISPAVLMKSFYCTEHYPLYSPPPPPPPPQGTGLSLHRLRHAPLYSQYLLIVLNFCDYTAPLLYRVEIHKLGGGLITKRPVLLSHQKPLATMFFFNVNQSSDTRCQGSQYCIFLKIAASGSCHDRKSALRLVETQTSTRGAML